MKRIILLFSAALLLTSFFIQVAQAAVGPIIMSAKTDKDVYKISEPIYIKVNASNPTEEVYSFNDRSPYTRIFVWDIEQNTSVWSYTPFFDSYSTYMGSAWSNGGSEFIAAVIPPNTLQPNKKYKLVTEYIMTIQHGSTSDDVFGDIINYFWTINDAAGGGTGGPRPNFQMNKASDRGYF